MDATYSMPKICSPDPPSIYVSLRMTHEIGADRTITNLINARGTRRACVQLLRRQHDGDACVLHS